MASMLSKKKARWPPSRYCTLCFELAQSTSMPASSIRRSSRSASNGIDAGAGDGFLVTSSMIESSLRFGDGSRPIARIDAVEHAEIGGPVGGTAAAVVPFVLRERLAADLRRDVDHCFAGRLHRQLDLRGLQEMLHQDESLARGPADREHAVIVQDHCAVAAEIGNEPLALAEILRDALVRMVSDAAVKAHGLLRDHPQAPLEAGDRRPRAGVDMHGAIDVRAPAHDAAVQREPRAIDPGALVEVGVHV